MARLCVTNGRRKKNMIALSMWLEMCTIVSWFLTTLCTVSSLHTRRLRMKSYRLNFYQKRDYIRRLVHANDVTCIEQLRMDKRSFFKLCEMLESIGGLKATKHLLIDEQVAMFLYILAHHQKNRVIKHNFGRSGETVSRYFHKVLAATIRLQDHLYQKPEPIPPSSTDSQWKYFTADGTHIRIRVPESEKPRYRNRKGVISTNVLAACTPNMQFVYVLSGWEGSAADGRVLRDAISRSNGLKVPQGCYFLVDAGYTNCDGFLAPFRGQRYHLSVWREGHQPTSVQEFCNMKHATARNVIERSFGLLKMRWGIVREASFYPIKIYNQIIISCCLLHNFIRKEMAFDPMEAELDEIENEDDEDDEEDPIMSIQATEAWTNWRVDLANKMYNEWKASRRASRRRIDRLNFIGLCFQKGIRFSIKKYL